MAASIQDLFSYVQLTELVQKIKPGLPKTMPEELWSTKDTVVGDKFVMPLGVGARDLPRVSPYMAPARQAQKYDMYTRPVKCIHTTEVMEFGEELMSVYREWAKYGPQEKRAMQLLTYQTDNFRKKFDNFRIATVGSLLALGGKIYFNSDNYMLNSSSGAALTIDQGVPAANIGNPSSVISAAWSSAATDIPTQVLNLKTLALKATNYPLAIAYYGKNVAGYLHNNTAFRDYLARNTPYNSHYLNTGLIADGVLGLKWVPVQDTYFVDASGSSLELFPADQVTFTPEISRETYTFYEGTTPVPAEVNAMVSDPETLLRGLKEVEGIGAYAIASHNPVQFYHHMFDTFMPLIKVPSAFYFVDTTP